MHHLTVTFFGKNNKPVTEITKLIPTMDKTKQKLQNVAKAFGRMKGIANPGHITLDDSSLEGNQPIKGHIDYSGQYDGRWEIAPAQR